MQGPNYTIDYIVPEDKTLETQGIKLSGGVAAGMSMDVFFPNEKAFIQNVNLLGFTDDDIYECLEWEITDKDFQISAEVRAYLEELLLEFFSSKNSDIPLEANA